MNTATTYQQCSTHVVTSCVGNIGTTPVSWIENTPAAFIITLSTNIKSLASHKELIRLDPK